jgi:hypothetical protein
MNRQENTQTAGSIGLVFEITFLTVLGKLRVEIKSLQLVYRKVVFPNVQALWRTPQPVHVKRFKNSLYHFVESREVRE